MSDEWSKKITSLDTPLDGIENVLEPENMPETDKRWQVISEAIVRAYAMMVIDEENRGITEHNFFTYKDYMKYRRPEDPHWESINDFLGGWTVARKILPLDHGGYIRQPYRSGKEATYENARSTLEEIRKYYGYDTISKISSRDYNNYKYMKNEQGEGDSVLDWKTYANHLVGGFWWKKFRDSVADYIYRKDVLKQ